ncbi:MAG TPA: FliH/SctL family protein [Bacilli bacterium]|nr:FliH/SctL family protein [Bacilli bacterium]
MFKANQTPLNQQAFSIRVAPIAQPPREGEDMVDPALEAMRRQAEEDAAAILARAREEADRLIQQAEQQAQGMLEAERGRVQTQLQQELEAAKQQGYREGREQSQQDVETEWASRFQTIEQLYLSALEERRAYLNQSESLIVELACAAAEKIMRESNRLGHEWVLHVVKAALEEIHDAGKIEVRVHPDDYELVRSRQEGLRKEVPGQTELLVIPDRGVGAGGCVLHTDFGNIDARIDTQLEEVKKALQEAAASLES